MDVDYPGYEEGGAACDEQATVLQGECVLSSGISIFEGISVA
jgi:hypothetical protein